MEAKAQKRRARGEAGAIGCSRQTATGSEANGLGRGLKSPSGAGVGVGARGQSAAQGLTDGGQLRHTSDGGAPPEAGLAVVDVLYLDDKLRFGLQQAVGLAVPGLSPQCVEGLLLPIKALRGVNVARQLINQEDGAGPLSRDGVLDGAVAFVGV